jgi:hypothetical protein
MWHETPEQRLTFIEQQHSAERSAMVADYQTRARDRSYRRGPASVRLRIRLGIFFIVVGRTLCGEDALRHDAAHS